MNAVFYLLTRLMRLLPPGLPGKTRLARQLLRRYRGMTDFAVKADGALFYIPNIQEPIGFHLLIDGIYEPALTAFLLSELKRGMKFVDVGANIGVFTVLAAKQVGASGKVVAVEPSARMYEYLSENVRENGITNVSIKNCAALGKNRDIVQFYEAPLEHFGMGSLAPQFGARPTRVAARTLDSILEEERIRHVDVLKVDVEGAEFEVFQGAAQLLASSSTPLIVFEFCDWAEERFAGRKCGDAQCILHDFGYAIWRMKDFLLGKEPNQGLITEGFETLIATRP